MSQGFFFLVSEDEEQSRYYADSRNDAIVSLDRMDRDTGEFFKHFSNDLKQNLNTNVLQCLQCLLCFSDSSYLRNHMTRFHADKMPFVCRTCGKGYLSKSGLYFHMQAHRGKRFKCPLCDRLFTQTSSIRPHVRAVHKSSQCPHCTMYFLMGQQYDSHVASCQK